MLTISMPEMVDDCLRHTVVAALEASIPLPRRIRLQFVLQTDHLPILGEAIEEVVLRIMELADDDKASAWPFEHHHRIMVEAGLIPQVHLHALRRG